MSKFKKLFHDDDIINRIQSNIEEQFDQSNYNDLIGIALIAGQDNIINHKLGRKFIGWQVIDINRDSNVWRINNNSPTLNLTLRCSASTTISLRIF